MKPTVRWLAGYIKKSWGWLALSLLLALAMVGLTLYVPLLVGEAIDCIVEAGNVDFARIGVLIGQIVALVCANLVCTWCNAAVNNRLTYSIVKHIRVDLFAHVARLPLSYLDTRAAGDTLSRMIGDVEEVADGLLLGFTQLFSGVVTIVATLVFMFYIHWPVAIAVLVVTPVSLFVARFIARKIHSHFSVSAATRAKQTALCDEMIVNQKTVQGYCRTAAVQAQFDKVNAELQQVDTKAVFYSSLTNPCTRFVNAVVYALVAALGALAVTGALPVGGLLSVGTLSVLLSYASQYTKPFNEISEVVTELQKAFVCASRVRELTVQPMESDCVDPVEVPCVGQVDLDNVDFSYVEDRPLIQGLNLHVKPGQRVAIVGPTGCGKTTVINLLMRFYDVDNGSIQVDGVDVRAMRRHTLRYRYGMVLQETWIRHATVRDNIALGKPDATFDEIVEAAKATHCDGFIRRLPQGYDTVIADDGCLSAGQKQLLCIARVMLCLPPMLILDEATSNIDTRTELKIQSAFATLMQGKTSFVVAHRLSTIRTADVILVMNQGHVIEMGRHDELMAKQGFYYTLYQSGLS